MKKLILTAALVGTFFAVGAKETDYNDPNKFATYKSGMASCSTKPMAVEWQKTNAAALEKAVAADVLAGFVESEEAALALLKQVKPDYATDPMVAEQIAAVSQYVMTDGEDSWWEFWNWFGDSARKIWTKALLKSAAEAKDAYCKSYYLDQLRWCAYPCQAKCVRAVGKKSQSREVCQFAAMIARELDGVETACKACACASKCAAKCSSPYGTWALTLPFDRMNAGHLIVSKGADGKPAAKLLWRWGSPFDVKDGDLKVTCRGFTLVFGNHKPKDMKQDKRLWCRDRVTATVTGDWLSCVYEKIDGEGNVVGKAETFSGRRNPPIGAKADVKSAKRGDTIDLLGGTIDDFELMEANKVNGWTLANGVLSNRIQRDQAGKSLHKNGNLRTKRADFFDFNLSYEVRVLPNCNSGVYLRGIYEIQVIDSYGKDVDCHNMAAYYGRVTPSKAAEKKAGEWQTVDVTLYKRHLTVVLNGVKIIDNVPVVGITGGAMTSDEFVPGPIYIQGDHSDADFRNMKLTPLY